MNGIVKIIPMQNPKIPNMQNRIATINNPSSIKNCLDISIVYHNVFMLCIYFQLDTLSYINYTLQLLYANWIYPLYTIYNVHKYSK